MGPTAGVLIGRAPTEADRGTVADLAKSLGEPGAGGVDGPDVFVITTKTFGGTYAGEGRPFWFEWQDDGYYDHLPTLRTKVEERFGLNPRATLLISAGMNRAADHRILGELALQLALVLDGVIDFDGALLPAASPARIGRLRWPEVATSVDEFLAPIPGNVIDIEYQVDESRWWAGHIGDCEFM